MTLAVGAIGFTLAWLLLLLDVEPVPTWFYVFAWYPTLLMADAFIARRGEARALHRRPATAASLLLWSVPIWLLFEASNFRLGNWYYVMLPASPVERWAGIVISFATVVPAVLLAERTLDLAGLGSRMAGRPASVRPWELRAATLVGALAAVASLGWPERWFPLIWGAAWLVADPWLYRLRPEWSLIGDVARGAWGRIVRLLVGGLMIGLLWETYNFWARGKWIYTVPGLESTKWFEMPPLGFLGFPIFALEAWTLYHLLCALGLAIPLSGPATLATRRRRIAGATIAVAFSALTLVGMEQWTISSTAPALDRLPLVTREQVDALRQSGLSAWRLAEVDPAELAEITQLHPGEAAHVVSVARLTLLRGIGTTHAGRLTSLGIASVCELARRDPDDLFLQLKRGAPNRPRPTPSEVRVWTGSARRHCEIDPAVR